MLPHKRMKYMSINLHLLMTMTQQARLPFVLDDKNNIGVLILNTNSTCGQFGYVNTIHCTDVGKSSELTKYLSLL